ncbi:uncharacterized protein TM35_000013460, partial [Trypanosoma theileri]
SSNTACLCVYVKYLPVYTIEIWNDNILITWKAMMSSSFDTRITKFIAFNEATFIWSTQRGPRFDTMWSPRNNFCNFVLLLSVPTIIREAMQKEEENNFFFLDTLLQEFILCPSSTPVKHTLQFYMT